MQLIKFKEEYQYFSSEVSKLVIQFALAGIAVVWIFKADKPGMPLIPHGLLWPLVCFVLSITFALLHYFVASIIWGAFYRYQERKHGGKTDVEVKANKLLPNIIWLFYFFKVLSLVLGFAFMSLFIFDRIQHPSTDPPTVQQPIQKV